MFKSIEFIDKYKNIWYQYKIIDDQFESIVGTHIWAEYGKFILIIEEYKRRNLSVPKNLALAYTKLNYINLPKYLMLDRDNIDLARPQLQYGKKYYRCTVNQVKHINYILNKNWFNELKILNCRTYRY